MTDEKDSNRFLGMKPEHYSVSAFVIAIVLGGGGVGLNFNSNKDVAAKLDAFKDVAAKLETFNITMTELKGVIKATNDDKVRLETLVGKQGDSIDKLKEEVVVLKEEIKALREKK